MGLCCSGPPRTVASTQIGPPTAATCPPGQCFFNEDWSKATLLDRYQVAHDSFLMTFALPDLNRSVGLSTCACLLCRFHPADGAEAVVRPYTPVSTNAMVGHFQLLVKVYEHGKMSQHLSLLPLGAAADFRHIQFNVKIQYPFGKKHITMLAGGTGITPMIQALHAILGTEDDTTQVSLLFGNKTQDDILSKQLLDDWASKSDGRLKVTHVLSQVEADDYWGGLRGRINKDILKAHSVPPSENVLVMVCGPPGMYNELCGPRDQKELTGTLSEMGYSASQVFKF
mmetsp:Transcript_52673/g.118664  ORF Transcript_52673/g.118664 Transcript_52673/m.118664 type:complete len:284 (-) Transcript_52673:89-940(-)